MSSIKIQTADMREIKKIAETGWPSGQGEDGLNCHVTELPGKLTLKPHDLYLLCPTTGRRAEQGGF